LLLDIDGRLWITDFGLAKAGDCVDLTEPGDVVGTLRYIAPERLQGQCDARADVYSLGITLYELLTKRPAFDATDRARLLERIARHVVTPPRRLTPSIPRDLETIVLKAMALEPADRYAKAEALADDLQRFLDDRPIHARRPTLGQKLKKWRRRNKGIVWTAMAAAVLLLFTISLSAAMAAFWLNQAWHVAEDRAEKLQQDIDSLKDANNLIEAAWSHSLQHKWRDAETDFTQAAQRRPDLALVWTERCDFHLRLGLWDRAADDSLHALRLKEPALPWFWHRHAVLRLYVGDIQGYRHACARMLERSEQTTDPELSYEVAHSCLLVPDAAVDPQRLLQLAERRMDGGQQAWHLATLGAAHYRAGHNEQAMHLLYKSLHSGPIWPGRALIHSFLAMLWHRHGQAGDAQYELQNAARVLDDMTQEMLRSEVGAMSHTKWIDLLGSLVLYREAKLLIEGLVLPDEPRLHVARARALAVLNETDHAAAACAKAVELEPRNVATHLECGWVYSKLGRWDKALPLLSEAATVQDDDTRFCRWWFPLAIAHWQTGEKDKARQWYDRAAKWMVKHQPGDAWLCRLRSEATAQLGIQDHLCFQGHTAQVRSAVFSPDGSKALSASHDGTLRLWNTANGEELRCLRGHLALVWSAALSPDGRRALSGGSDLTLRLWDVETGKELRRLRDSDGWIMCVAFSPDGRRALSGGGGSLYLWDLESGQKLDRWEGHTGWVRSVAFSPDGRHALSGSNDKSIRLWDMATGKELRCFLALNAVLSVAFSPDGRQALAGGCDQTVHMWDIASGKELRAFRGHQGNVESVVFSPDGRWVLSGGADGTIRVWNVTDGSEVEGFGTEKVLSVAFSPDGRKILSAHADNQVRLWCLDQRSPEKAASHK
jgi:WD40 repeat protein